MTTILAGATAEIIDSSIIIAVAIPVSLLDAIAVMNFLGYTFNMMNYAQQYTHAINWNDLDTARKMLEQSGAFDEGQDTRLKMPKGHAK